MTKKINWHTAKRRVKELIPYDRNPNKMSKEQDKHLTNSINQFDLVETPVINTDNKIIAGHQRVRKMVEMGRGEEMIDVRVPNRELSNKEFEKYLIASNSIKGEWDLNLLKDFDLDMLLDVGVDTDVLNDIWSDIDLEDEEEFDEEKELEKIIDPKTKTGDLIILGNHRLICGDSNNPEVIKRLCEDQYVDMIMSDPPYNINLNYRTGLGGKKNYGSDVKDNLSEKEYIEFLRSNIKNALEVAKPNCHVFYWNTEQHIWIIQTLFSEMKLNNKRVCMWVKNAQNPTPQVAFSKCYEPCIYATQGKPFLNSKESKQNEILNKEIGTGNALLDDLTNIWGVKRLSTSQYKHATSKPVDLYEKPINRCTKVGDLILDTFGGSGSLLIACEKLKRRAFLVEKSPQFCDLIVSRYKKLNGSKEIEIRHHD